MNCLLFLLGFCLVFVSAEEQKNVKEEVAGGYYGDYNNYNAQDAILIHDNYICSNDVGFATYGGRKRYYYPVERTCDSAVDEDSCGTCCKITARLAGIQESDIKSMVLVYGSKLRCSCCAPIRKAMAQPAPTYGAAAPAYVATAAPAYAPTAAASATGY